MPVETRALLFDLDDTLYPVRWFVWSGFDAVARHLAAAHGVDAAVLGRHFRAARRARGREIQAVLRAAGLPESLTPELLAVIRRHVPRLRLPRPSAAVLRALRPDWALAIVTNGDPLVQARKVRALGLDAMVDAVVYAHADGGQGKPDPAPFARALARLGVGPDRAAFVGDDEDADIGGASRAGMRTIRGMWYRRPANDDPSAADAVVRAIAEVPAAAARLMEERRA